MITYNLFSTPIKIISVPNFEEIKNILFNAFQFKFNRNFNQNLNEEENIKTALYFTEEINNFWKEITNEKRTLSLQTSWVNFSNKYNFVTPHSHGNCLLSCVFYLKVDDKSGDILFHDTRGGVYFAQQKEIDTQGNEVDNRKYFRVKPKNADLIIFPSYLVHSVEPNMSDINRVCLAMNFG
jgi:uncharacterized protein (TIGR02466 family)